MSRASEDLEAALRRAMTGRPKIGGFPYFAETLRRAGVVRNRWSLPSCQSVYWTEHGVVVMTGTPLFGGTADVPAFDRDALIAALRTDQAGESTFPEFLRAAWNAGVLGYEVDLLGRTVTYHGPDAESYVESYPLVSA